MDTSSDSFIILKNDAAEAHFDLLKGAKLIKLVLLDPIINTPHTIIQDPTTDQDYLCGGSYLMFPWVGRLEKPEITLEDGTILKVDPVFKDGNGLPLHALVANKPRKVLSQTANTLSVALVERLPADWAPHFPIFSETFTLEKSRLIVRTEFSNISGQKPFEVLNGFGQKESITGEDKGETQYFGYGYHPYVGIDNKSINNFIVKTNLTYNNPLNKKTLLPELNDTNKISKIPITEVFPPGTKLGETHLDHLFSYDLPLGEYKEPYLQVLDKDSKLGVEVKAHLLDENWPIPLHWWQVYTSLDRKSIAVEPKSSPGNAFYCEFPQQLVEIEPGKKMKGQWHIQLFNLPVETDVL